MNFSITQNGKELIEEKYNWDENTKTLSTNEDNLVLDFSEYDEVIFNTGDYCTFKTGNYCTFKTGNYCTFDIGDYCTFKTGNYCTFDTGNNCTFKTGNYCTFDTGFDCTFETGSDCTFDTSYNCTFTCKEKCVCIRRDIYEVIEIPENIRRDIYEIIEIPENKTIILNEYGIKGYTHQKRKIVIDSKEIEMSEESYQNLKNSFK